VRNRNPVAIVGAGAAGLACARRLRAAGVDVQLFDKGRHPGGRISTRTTPIGTFDHGAQLLRDSEPAFASEMSALRQCGVLVPWVLPGVRSGTWTAVPAMRQLAATWAANLRVQCGTTVGSIRGCAGRWRLRARCVGAADIDVGPFDAVLLTLPVPQLVSVLPEAAPAPPNPHYAPCWTLMAGLATGRDAGVCPERAPDGPVAWVAAEHRKPGRGGVPRITVQAGPDWSAQHAEMPPAAVEALMVQGLAAEGMQVTHAVVHRWRYARVLKAASSPLWCERARLGYAGDGFAGPRIGAAWRSGVALAARYLEAAGDG